MSNSENDSSQSWEHARAYSNLLGAAPSSFTTAIRQLKADCDKGGALSRGTAFQAGRLCNSPSLGASLISAAKSIFPECGVSNSSELVTKLPAEALAGLIGVAYYYRKAKKLANEEEWPHYTKILPTRAELSTTIGKNIAQIGITRGILMGAIDTIALTCFHLHDKKGFTEYRRALKSKNQRENVEFENQRWGCNRYHVGAMLIQALGFGIDFANEYANGMLGSPSDEKYLSSEAYRFYIGKVWLEALQDTGKEPDRSMRVEFYPDRSGLSALTSAAQKLISNPPSVGWLDAVKVDEKVIEDEPGSED
jgi:hypothetical protein